MASFESIWIRYIDVGNRFGNFRKQISSMYWLDGMLARPHVKRRERVNFPSRRISQWFQKSRDQAQSKQSLQKMFMIDTRSTKYSQATSGPTSRSKWPNCNS